MSTAIAPECVGDWWMCKVCGNAQRWPAFACNHNDIYIEPLTLTEADWLKCRSRDALSHMMSHFIDRERKMLLGMPLKELTRDHASTVENIRCVFGNPFRPFVPDQAWLAWNDGTVKRLAEGCVRMLPCPGCYDGTCSCDPRYHDHDVKAEQLLLVADALEEAGCTIDHVLRHLREPGQHWPNCFVLRAILG